jgi:hypothetical protein
MTACPLGYYSSSNAGDCTPTEEGTISTSTGQINSGDAVAANQWAVEGSYSAIECPPGY